MSGNTTATFTEDEIEEVFRKYLRAKGLEMKQFQVYVDNNSGPRTQIAVDVRVDQNVFLKDKV